MGAGQAAAKSRAKGNIEPLPTGSLRVRVYAGIDPVSKKQHYLKKVIAPGPKARQEAEAALAEFVSQVRERRHPRTSAPVDVLLARYLTEFDGAPTTLDLYRGYVRKHISPFVGHLPVGELDADVLDSFYAELRRCRDHCTGTRVIRHRTNRQHDCDSRCRPHVCQPLGDSTVRHIHFILSGAYKRAVRWRWVTVSPISQAEPPPAPKPNPQPPTPAQAARIVTEAWRDLDWGTLIWTTMTTGARRGELCAVRWSLVDLDQGRESIWLRKAIRKENGIWVEANLKSHQQRRIALDQETASILRDYREHCRQRTDAIEGLKLDPDGFVFSLSLDGTELRNPEGVSQRYDRLAERLRIKTTFHKLRHYNATELILAGVDIRTVAGRLGHAGGGTTTLRTYTAWVSEADQRAARGFGAAMPARPAQITNDERAQIDPRYPYEKIAATIRRKIISGEIPNGSALPPEKQFIVEHQVSTSTARRVIALLRRWELLPPTGRQVITPAANPGVPQTTSPPSGADETEPGQLGPVAEKDGVESGDQAGSTDAVQLLDLQLRKDGEMISSFTAKASASDADKLERLLIGALRRLGADSSDVDSYELEVRQRGDSTLLTTFVMTA